MSTALPDVALISALILMIPMTTSVSVEQPRFFEEYSYLAKQHADSGQTC
jgi:hypothetical protein